MKPFTASLAEKLLHDTSFGVSVVDGAGVIAHMNQGYCSMIGFGIEELVGRSMASLFDPESAVEIAAYHTRVLASETPNHIKLKALHKSGHPVFLAIESFRHEVDGKPYCVSIVKDVTAIEHALAGLTERNQTIDSINHKLSEHRLALDQSANIILTDANGYILEVNDHTCNLSGYSREELVGQHSRINKSGLHDDSFYDELWTTIRSGRIWRGEIINRKKDGSLYWVDTTIVPMSSRAGENQEFLAIRFDITERKEHEARLHELNLQLTKKARALSESNTQLEQFAFVISHDLQEPIRMIVSFLTLLQKKYETQLDDKAQEYILFAVNGSKQMREIIRDLLEYSTATDRFTNLVDVDLNQLVQKVLLQHRRAIQDNEAKVTVGLLPQVRSYEYPLESVINNLIDNALKYRHPDRTPEISIHASEYDESWMIRVRDNGIGICQDYYDKIFVIFQRLHNKTEYTGTGVGLSLVKKIIEGLGGNVTVDSEEGSWTEFTFTIPKVAN